MAPVSAATDVNKGIPVTMDRATEENELFDVVTYIRFCQGYEKAAVARRIRTGFVREKRTRFILERK
jgi:hypothetical protein